MCGTRCSGISLAAPVIIYPRMVGDAIAMARKRKQDGGDLDFPIKSRASGRFPAESTVYEWVGKIALNFASMERSVEKTLKVLRPIQRADEKWSVTTGFARKCDILKKSGTRIFENAAVPNPVQRAKRFQTVIDRCLNLGKQRNSRIHALSRGWTFSADMKTILEVTTLQHHTDSLVVDKIGLTKLKELALEIPRVEGLLRHHRAELAELVPFAIVREND